MNAGSISPRLLETLLWEPAGGYFLLARHEARLACSARALGYGVDLAEVRGALDAAAGPVGGRPRRVRLTVDRGGGVHASWSEAGAGGVLRAEWAERPVRSTDPRLRHKTTDRALYDEARAGGRPGTDEVLLWNERDEATETSTGNLVVEIEGARFTPPLDAGLLPGTFRAHLLDAGHIRERRLRRADVERAGRVYHVNSVRRWCPLRLRGRP